MAAANEPRRGRRWGVGALKDIVKAQRIIRLAEQTGLPVGGECVE
ncbi:hypothetical protein Msi02_68630 [Microbispora siamensis]|uniref:Transposase n=1 Tax=Microbispora siamensis TaxID=564413 RepID=A0ABQ4GXA4_9ACTN|nr:hypothetical protein Msi02_68630 [Microbispora siamensis]